MKETNLSTSTEPPLSDLVTPISAARTMAGVALVGRLRATSKVSSISDAIREASETNGTTPLTACKAFTPFDINFVGSGTAII